MMKTLAALLGVLASCAGCAPSFNRIAMQEKLWDGVRLFTDDDVRRVEELRPQLPSPFRLAVAPPLVAQSCWDLPEDVEGERDAILAWGEKLKQEGVVSDFILIPRLLLGLRPHESREGYLKAVRLAAARCRADAVLILSSVTDVDGYANVLSVLDLTLVGMLIVPGHHKAALTIVEGVVLDNRNEYLYMVASAEATGVTTAPLAMLDERDASRKSRLGALHKFGETLSKEAHRFRPRPAGPRYETPK